MSINELHIQGLLEMLVLTKPQETDCGHCLEHMAEFAEQQLTGRSFDEGMRNIEEHLERCGDCQEEFSALKEALSNRSHE